jgi:hypothetical protein
MPSDDFNMVVVEIPPAEADWDFAQPPNLAQVLDMVRPAWQSCLFGDFGDQFGASHLKASFSSDKKNARGTPAGRKSVSGAGNQSRWDLSSVQARLAYRSTHSCEP